MTDTPRRKPSGRPFQPGNQVGRQFDGADNPGKPFLPGVNNGLQPFVPTDEQRAEVKLLSGFGITQEAIAAHIGCDKKTLSLRFRDDLDAGMLEANRAVVNKLWAHATGDSVPAAIYWTKARMGWTDKVEVSGPGGTPMQMVMKIVTGVPRDGEDDAGE